MSSPFMLALANHLWQSTLFVTVIWLVTLALRKNSAAARHRLWLIASIKFLIPFSLLTMLGNFLAWQAAPQVPAFVETMNRPFALPFAATTEAIAVQSSAVTAPKRDEVPIVLFSIWVCGFAANLLWWSIGWARMRRALQRSTAVDLQFPLRVMASSERVEPGVFGIFRPILLIPAGIEDRLSAEQLQAVLAHELCHVQRRDNLTAGIHMVVEALFWFHPFVWWIKARLIEEQERARDEAVLSLGSDPQIYAESILKICEFYVTSPLICVSGITGANLKKRIGEIVNYRVKPQLGFSRILLVTLTLLLCVSAPFTVGVFHAQSTTPPVSNLEFDAISIRPITAGEAIDQKLLMGLHCHGVDGELFNDAPSTVPLGRCTGITFGQQLIGFAYTPDVRVSRLRIENLPREFDSPAGPGSVMYQIQAVAPDPSRATRAHLQLMLQSLLRDRFKLKVHRETRDVEGIHMTVARGGIKFKKSSATEETCCPILTQDGKEFQPDGERHSVMTKGAASMGRVASFVATMLSLGGERGPIEDKTNLPGLYDITFLLDMVAPIGGERGGGGGQTQPAQFDPPLAKALEQQLGLTLQAGKIPFQSVIVDHIEKPSEN
jgi:bla regulator protein BlaR1